MTLKPTKAWAVVWKNGEVECFYKTQTAAKFEVKYLLNKCVVIPGTFTPLPARKKAMWK